MTPSAADPKHELGAAVRSVSSPDPDLNATNLEMKLNAVRTFLSALSLTAAALGVTLPAQAAVYSLKGDWSDTNNPNGPWSYLAAGAPLPSNTDWIGFGPSWNDPRLAGNLHPNGGNGLTPGLTKYEAGSEPEPIDAVDGDIVGHSDDGIAGFNSGAGLLSMRFVSPAAGLASIDGRIWDAHLSVDRDQVWELWVDNALQTSGILLGDGTEGRNNADIFSASGIGMAVGSIVEFRVSRVQDNIGGLFGVELDITVEPTRVPTPATLPLVALALTAAIWTRARRKA